MKSNMSKDFKRKAGLRNCANGGPIRGPGGPTDDQVPIMGSDGEYILPADTVAHVGKENLDALKDATHAPVRKMADGGVIDIDPEGYAKPRTPSASAGQLVPVQQRTLPPSTGAQPGGLKSAIDRYGLNTKSGALDKLGRGVGAVQAGAGLYEGATNGLTSGAVDNTLLGAATTLNPVVGALGNAAKQIRDAGLNSYADSVVPRDQTATPALRKLIDGAGGMDNYIAGVKSRLAAPAPAAQEPVAQPAAQAAQTGDQFLEQAGIQQNDAPLYKARTRLGQLGSGFIGSRAALQGSSALLGRDYNRAVRGARLGLEQRKFNYEMGEKGSDRLGNLLNDTFQTYDDKGKPIGPDKVAQEGFKDFVAQSDARFHGLNGSQLQQKLNQLDPQDQAKLVSQFKSQYKVNQAINNVQGRAMFGGRTTNKLDPAAELRSSEVADLGRGLPVLDYLKTKLNPFDAGVVSTRSGRVARLADVASNPAGNGYDQDIIDTLEKQSGRSTGLRRGE